MSQLSDYVVKRLNALLPLAERQGALSPELREIHREFLRSLVNHGRPLSRAEIARMAPEGDAAAAILTLAANDLIVLDKNEEPIGAYPVTLDKTLHLVEVDGNAIHAMCAFDAVSVAPMFDKRVTISSRCPATGARIQIEQNGDRIVRALPSAEIQVGIWWRAPGSCAARNFCTGIVFLKDRAAALQWQAGEPENREFAGLEDAIAAGQAFFRPLMGVPTVAAATR